MYNLLNEPDCGKSLEFEFIRYKLQDLPLNVYMSISPINGEKKIKIISKCEFMNDNFELEILYFTSCETIYELKADYKLLIRTSCIADICDIIITNFDKFIKFDFDIDVFNYIPHMIECKNLDIKFDVFDHDVIVCKSNDDEYIFHYKIKTNDTDRSYSFYIYDDTDESNSFYIHNESTYYSSFSMYDAIIDIICDHIKNHTSDKQIIQTETSNRINKDEYYVNIAKTVLQRSTCLRRKFGAVIVKNDRIISTGYNGAPAGRRNCCDIGTCFRQENNIQPGQRYELCRSIHAEQNAIIYAGYDKCKGSTLYLIGFDVTKNDYMESCDCCAMCKRIIIQSGIKTVVFGSSSGEIKTIDVSEWIENDDSLIIHEGY